MGSLSSRSSKFAFEHLTGVYSMYLGWMSNNFFWRYSQKRSLARRRRRNFLNPTWKKLNLWVVQAKNPTFQDFPGYHRCVSSNKPQFSRILKKKVALSRIFQVFSGGWQRWKSPNKTLRGYNKHFILEKLDLSEISE